MPQIQYPTHRFDRLEMGEYMVWNPHLYYPALTPYYQIEAAGYGPGRTGLYRTGELPGTGWHGQSFANNPSPADFLRLGARVPTQGDQLMNSMLANVRA